MPAIFAESAFPTTNLHPGSQSTEPTNDPAQAAFLKLLERDIRQHPEHLIAISAEEREKARRLTEGVSFDLEKPLTGLDDE